MRGVVVEQGQEVADTDDSGSSSETSETSLLGDTPGPYLCDFLSACRMWCGLQCFRCIRDPFVGLRKLGIDFSRSYVRCGTLFCIVTVLLIALICFCLWDPAILAIYGLALPITLIPWAAVCFLIGTCFLLLACTSRLGVHIMLTAVGSTQKDPDKPKRVRKAYRKIGSLHKDLSMVDRDSAFAIRLMLRSCERIQADAIARGFNADVFDGNSQRYLLAACVLAAADPKQLNDSLRVYIEDTGDVKVCRTEDVPARVHCRRLDETLLGSGGDIETALSMKLMPAHRAQAVFLRKALGRSYDKSPKGHFSWLRKSIADSVDAVDEYNAVRLLAVLHRDDRKKVVVQYDKLYGGPGSFEKDVSETRMPQEFIIALHHLGGFGVEEESLLASLREAIAQHNKHQIIRLLCGATRVSMSSIPVGVKHDIYRVFGMKPHEESSRGFISTINSTINSAWGEVKTDASQAYHEIASTIDHVATEVLAAIKGGDIRDFIKLLLRHAKVPTEQDHLDELLVSEIHVCLDQDDPMGLIGILMHLDSNRKDKVKELFMDDVGSDDDLALVEHIVKMDWGILELALIGSLMSQEWVWARVIYEACCGGLVGLGTDEQTLTSAIVLNWGTRDVLRDALVHYSMWKRGEKVTLEELISEEIESDSLRLIMLDFLSGSMALNGLCTGS